MDVDVATGVALGLSVALNSSSKVGIESSNNAGSLLHVQENHQDFITFRVVV